MSRREGGKNFQGRSLVWGWVDDELGRDKNVSPRKTILRELDQLHSDEGNGRYARPSSLPGFGTQPSRYQEAVNGLLSERLIDGKKDDEGHMAIALNPHRLDTVRKELRPWFARPVLWLVVFAVGVVVGALFLR